MIQSYRTADTPRTDAEVLCYCEKNGTSMVSAHFSRKLERELNDAKRMIGELEERVLELLPDPLT